MKKKFNVEIFEFKNTIQWRNRQDIEIQEKSESWSSSYLLLKAYSILCLVRGLEAFLIIGK